MSDDVLNGGPAFPTVDSEDSVGIFAGDKGMSLRDYFAAKFAASIHSKNADFSVAIGRPVATAAEICAGAYRWADGMLMARKTGIGIDIDMAEAIRMLKALNDQIRTNHKIPCMAQLSSDCVCPACGISGVLGILEKNRT